MRHNVDERKSIRLVAATAAFHRVAISRGHQRTTTAATPTQGGGGETLELLATQLEHPIIPCPQPSTAARLRHGPTVPLSTMAAACGSALCAICRPGPRDPRSVHITVCTPPCAHTLCTLCAHHRVHTPVCTPPVWTHMCTLCAHAHFVHTSCAPLCAHFVHAHCVHTPCLHTPVWG